MIKIGLITAMQVESKFLNNIKEKTINKIGNFCVSEFIINNCKIVSVVSGVGEIKAAAAVEMLIALYKVDIIFNVGLVGSLIKAELAEMCFVKSVVHFDRDTSIIDHIPVGQYDDMPSPLMPVENKYCNILKTIRPNFKWVVCASSDKFVYDENIKTSLNKTYGAEICDMEAAGVLITSNINNVPCVFVKMISDSCNHAEEFSVFCSRNMNEFFDILSDFAEIISK